MDRDLMRLVERYGNARFEQGCNCHAPSDVYEECEKRAQEIHREIEGYIPQNVEPIVAADVGTQVCQCSVDMVYCDGKGICVRCGKPRG